jgi:hypothetical protein
MDDWKFSWRAVGAWAAGAALGSLVFAGICTWADLAVSPDDAGDYPAGFALIWGVGVLALLAIGGAVALVASLLARRVRWPRPWVEMIVAAALCYVVTHIGGVTINVGDEHGVAQPMHSFPAFVLEFICTPLTGAATALVYWWLAGRPGTRAPA